MNKELSIPGLIFILTCGLTCGLGSAAFGSSPPPLKAQAPIALPGKSARFDYMRVDSRHDRLLAAHKGAGALVLVDLKKEKVLSPLDVGHIQGIAIDDRSNTYVLGADDEHKVVFVNAMTLKKIGEVATNGPVDAVAFDPKNGMAYADEDGGSHVWVVDVKHQKLVATISIPGVPEYVDYDPKTDRIYQNIKSKDSLVVINPANDQVEVDWSTLPATGPHGLAIDSQTGRVFSAGRNGKLVAIDLKSGKVFSQADIAPGTDQISFDAAEKTIYCASKGFISVVKETDSGLQSMGDLPVHAGAHTVAVDSKRRQAWVSYADSEHSYLQKFEALQ